MSFSTFESQHFQKFFNFWQATFSIIYQHQLLNRLNRRRSLHLLTQILQGELWKVFFTQKRGFFLVKFKLLFSRQIKADRTIKQKNCLLFCDEIVSRKIWWIFLLSESLNQSYKKYFRKYFTAISELLLIRRHLICTLLLSMNLGTPCLTLINRCWNSRLERKITSHMKPG